MPYIKQKTRSLYDKEIDSLVQKLTNYGGDIPNMGNLNYVFSKIIWGIFDKNPSYKLGNELVGVIECIKQEFYRRKLSELENKKILENGDINV